MLMGPGWFRRQNSDDHSRNRCHHALCAGVGLASYGRHYTGTKPETVDTRQADALRSRPVLSYSETGKSLVRIHSPRLLSAGSFRRNCRLRRHGCQLRRRLASSYAVGAMPGGLAALAARKCGTGEVATAAGWRRLRRVLEAR